MKKKRSILSSFRPETVIILIIICCLIKTVSYHKNNRMYGYVAIDDTGSITILHEDSDIENYKNAGNELIEFQPDSCRLLEVFSYDLTKIFSIRFIDEIEGSSSIDAHPELIDVYRGNERGSVDINYKGEDISIYYQWAVFPNGKSYLISFSYSVDSILMLREHLVLLYVAIILSFILLTIIFYWHIRSISARYRAINIDYRNSTL